MLERIAGIEPTHPVWKTGVLPLNYIRMYRRASSPPAVNKERRRNMEEYLSHLFHDILYHRLSINFYQVFLRYLQVRIRVVYTPIDKSSETCLLYTSRCV